jgi:hypothetical protein
MGMADGAGIKLPVGGDVVEQPRISRWLLGTRPGLLTVACLISAFALLVATAFVGIGGLIGSPLGWYFLAASTLFWLPVMLFALDAEETVASGPRLLMPVVTSGLLVALTTLVVVDDMSATPLLADTPPRVAFFAFLALAIVPRIWNAALFAYHRARNRRAAENAARHQPASGPDAAEAIEERLESYRNAESLGAVLATILFFGIAGGAIYLGMQREGVSLAAGIGQGLFVGVVALFATIVFLDWIARFPPLRATANAFNRAAPRMRFLVDFYDLLDTALVRLGAHVAGADHLKTRSRYGILIATLGSLAVLAWFLPPPLGLAPIAIGLLVALSLSRLWAWVEEDRDMASITGFSPLAPQRVGFREDFRDETLLGFIFALVLLPIAWMQADQGVTQIFQYGNEGARVPEPRDFGMWLGYFGFELAKALPIVDWADIYKLAPGDASIQPAWPNGAHAIFLARALVDLILIASLLQAIGIASRNTQQKSLFAVGQINRLDELVEKAALARAVRETRIGGSDTTFDLAKLANTELVDFRRYDLTRLRQIYAGSNDDPARKAFIEQIFRQRGQPLDPAIVVAQNIAATHRNELLLFRTIEQALSEHEARTHRIELEDIRVLMFELRNTSGMRDLKERLIEVAETRVGASPAGLLLMLRDVAVGAQGERDLFQYTTRLAAESMRRVIPKVDDCLTLQETLSEVLTNGPAAFGAAAAAYNALVDTLRKRIDETCPPPPETN